MTIRATLVDPGNGGIAARPRVSVVVTAPAADVSADLLTVAASASVLGASLTMVVPVSRLSYISLSASLELNTSGLFQYFPDPVQVFDAAKRVVAKGVRTTVAVPDQKSFSLTRPFADSFGLVEAFTKVLIFTRSALDSLSTSDTERLEIGKGLSDSAVTQDILHRIVGKTIYDAVVLTDQAAVRQIDTKRPVLDAIGVPDLPTFATGKALIDSAAFADVASQAVAKLVADAASALDVARMSVGKTAADLAEAADAFEQSVDKALTDAASTPDATAAAVSKSTADQAFVGDAAEQSVAKLLADAAALADATRALLDKGSADQASATDAAQRGLDKSLSDAPAAVDSAAKGVTKDFADSVSLTDSFVKFLGGARDYADAQSVADHAALATTLALLEAAQTQDALARAFVKSLVDGVGINDATDLTDGVTYLFNKSFSNVAFATDTDVLGIALRKAEAVNTADAGSLLSQGYCDLSYFADDYVGDARTF